MDSRDQQQAKTSLDMYEKVLRQSKKEQVVMANRCEAFSSRKRRWRRRARVGHSYQEGKVRTHSSVIGYCNITLNRSGVNECNTAELDLRRPSEEKGTYTLSSNHVDYINHNVHHASNMQNRSSD